MLHGRHPDDTLGLGVLFPQYVMHSAMLEVKDPQRKNPFAKEQIKNLYGLYNCPEHAESMSLDTNKKEEWPVYQRKLVQPAEGLRDSITRCGKDPREDPPELRLRCLLPVSMGKSKDLKSCIIQDYIVSGTGIWAMLPGC